MPDVIFITPVWASLMTFAILVCGAYIASVLKGLLVPGRSRSTFYILLEPIRLGCQVMRRETLSTERPDTTLWALAPASYAAVAACALTVVPIATFTSFADVRTGIVLFGAAEALAIVAVFLHGWAPNSLFPLIGGYRFIALGLSYELLSMFVLIAASLPAESLQVSQIVQSQTEVWNIVRQPLSLPLWIIVTLGVTFTGPLNLADSADLCGGTVLEESGIGRLVWSVARGAMQTVFCAMGASIILGGWLGPWFPGWFWILIKTLSLMALVTWIGSRFARVPGERAVLYLWTIGLPLSFFHLLLAGIEALL